MKKEPAETWVVDSGSCFNNYVMDAPLPLARWLWKMPRDTMGCPQSWATLFGLKNPISIGLRAWVHLSYNAKRILEIFIFLFHGSNYQERASKCQNLFAISSQDFLISHFWENVRGKIFFNCQNTLQSTLAPICKDHACKNKSGCQNKILRVREVPNEGCLKKNAWM